MAFKSKKEYKETAIEVISRVCDADNPQRTFVFTIDDFIYYYDNYIKE